ncbi:sulfotransferase domain-containing protein [Amaricoccus tamworthensis]|uniref:sulfotransferase domain-containing protein n=1 Tax=Amaricoccus tamworthensis TaxID=57002 RepID=UPI003C7B10B3
MTTPPVRKPVKTPAGFNPPAEPPKEVGPLQRAQTFWKKNRGLTGNPKFWNIARRMLAMRARTTFGKSKVLQKPDLIFVATHHKAMTTYFHAVQKSLAFALNIPFERLQGGVLPSNRARMFLSMQGKQDLSKLPKYRGVHVMRDPRDMIVSGYHYHKWTHEEWVHRLDDNGRSYQDKLNSLSKTEGLFLEIDHFIFYYRETLENWNMEDPDMLEVSYESLMQPGKDGIYGDIFRHLGFVDEELELAVDLMRLFEASSRSGKSSGAISQKSHVRSGKSGQWEAELEPEHLAYIEQELGPVLRRFGYT